MHIIYKTSICYTLFERTNRINSGIIEDDTFWGVIYAAKETPDMDIFNIETAKEANPLYDYSEPLRDDLIRQITEAQNDVVFENSFKRFHLGLWTQSVTRFVASEKWEACKTAKKIKKHKKEQCYLGIHLSNRATLTSIAAYFPKSHSCYLYFWIPREAANDL